MQFAGRDLKPLAEPIAPDQLVVGEVYSSVQFIDQDMFAPVVEPVVFLGNDLDPGSEGAGHYFQDASSFLAGVHWSPGAPEQPDDAPDVQVYQQRLGQIMHIYEFERALDVLLKCSLRRSNEPKVHYRGIAPRRPTRS